MFHILGFLFIFIICILFLGVMLIFRFLGSVGRLFGLRKNTHSNNSQRSYTTTSESYSNSSGNTQHTGDGSHKKLFAEDEGEYVEFEEVE